MTLTIESAASPRWADAGQTIIDLAVKFTAFDESLPFTASPTDQELHGRDIYARALAGEYGPISPYIAPPPTIPQSVTRRQARQALLLAGKLGLVQPAIDAIPDATQRGLLQIEWDDAQEFDRNRPSLIAIGGAIGLDAAGIDALFVQAAAL